MDLIEISGRFVRFSIVEPPGARFVVIRFVVVYG